MMMNTRFSLKALSALALAGTIGFAQAGAIDALKKFNSDADGLSGSFSQTVKTKRKPKPPAVHSKSNAPAYSAGNTPIPINK